MKTKQKHHYIEFTDGSRAKLKATTKSGGDWPMKEAKDYAEKVYKKTVKKMETW